MTDPGSRADSTTGSLLSREQEHTCQDLSAREKGLASQRAIALLSLNGGATQLQAATVSGLTIGQVRYLLYTFRRKGMVVFPSEDNFSDSASKPAVSTSVSVGMAEPQTSPEKKKKTELKKDKDKVSKKKTNNKKNKKNAKKKKSKKSKKK